MTTDEYLRQGTVKLGDAGVASARLDVLILLEDATGKDRSWLLAHPEHQLDNRQADGLDKQLARRVQHEPLAYIRNRSEFYGRTFYVDHRVLEPRPESETMITLLKTLGLPDDAVIIDVGTGSGALAISAKLELPATRVYATDIDPDCLDVARRNADALSADITIIQGDLLAPAAGSDDLPPAGVILANLPYVPDEWQINQAAMSEPRIAIFGGPDGMDLYRRMFSQMDALLHKPGYIITESLPPHHGVLKDIAATHGYRQHQAQDFIQVFVSDDSTGAADSR